MVHPALPVVYSTAEGPYPRWCERRRYSLEASLTGRDLADGALATVTYSSDVVARQGALARSIRDHVHYPYRSRFRSSLPLSCMHRPLAQDQVRSKPPIKYQTLENAYCSVAIDTVKIIRRYKKASRGRQEVVKMIVAEGRRPQCEALPATPP